MNLSFAHLFGAEINIGCLVPVFKKCFFFLFSKI